MEIKKVRLEVPTIEAVRITKDNIIEVAFWAGGTVGKYRTPDGDRLKIVVGYEGRLTDGQGYYIGDWLIKNPEQPGHLSSMSDEMFQRHYTETEAVSPGEIAQIIEETMALPSRSARSLAFEAAGRVFERILQRTGKKVYCSFCRTENGINEMSERMDGDPSSMCKPCEVTYSAKMKQSFQQVADLALDERRKKLKEWGQSERSEEI